MRFIEHVVFPLQGKFYTHELISIFSWEGWGLQNGTSYKLQKNWLIEWRQINWLESNFLSEKWESICFFQLLGSRKLPFQCQYDSWLRNVPNSESLYLLSFCLVNRYTHKRRQKYWYNLALLQMVRRGGYRGYEWDRNHYLSLTDLLTTSLREVDLLLSKECY